MKIIFYDAKQYDIDSFEKQRKNYPDIESIYLEADLTEDTPRAGAARPSRFCAFLTARRSAPFPRRARARLCWRIRWAEFATA